MNIWKYLQKNSAQRIDEYFDDEIILVGKDFSRRFSSPIFLSLTAKILLMLVLSMESLSIKSSSTISYSKIYAYESFLRALVERLRQMTHDQEVPGSISAVCSQKLFFSIIYGFIRITS